MDDTLSQFIEQTGTDPSLARDLLESTKWNVDEALGVFETLSLGSSTSHSDEQRGDNNRITSGKGKRGLSMVNADIVGEARHKVIEDKVPGTDERYERFEEMSDFSFVLPDLTNFSEELNDFLRRDLIETSALVALEQAGKRYKLDIIFGFVYNITRCKYVSFCLLIIISFRRIGKLIHVLACCGLFGSSSVILYFNLV